MEANAAVLAGRRGIAGVPTQGQKRLKKHDGQRVGFAGARMEPAHDDVDGFLGIVGCGESGGGLSIQPAGLGELQTIRFDGFNDSVYVGTGLLSEPLSSSGE